MAKQHMLALKNVFMSYGSKPVLLNINLAVSKGEWWYQRIGRQSV
ncbi:hypothetical protein [Vibrio chaetopteri]|uniref:Uncharacterized protein n=1 Tax=Vibrio chaetopteri TaxID=3016528 RepID=A0AAU8BUK0_9VIBR